MELNKEIIEGIAKELEEEKEKLEKGDYEIAYGMWLKRESYLVQRFKEEREIQGKLEKLVIRKLGDQYSYCFVDWEEDEELERWVNSWAGVLRDLELEDMEVIKSEGNLIIISGKPEKMEWMIKEIDEERKRKSMGICGELKFPFSI